MKLNPKSTLPFLDISLIRNINKQEFKVYRKPTFKYDHIHFYSHHYNNTKRGIVVGFYLRALRICFPKYSCKEFNQIENFFLTLLNPKSFMHFAKSKALKIHNKNQRRTNANLQSYKTSRPHAFITLPNNSSSNIIINNLNKLDIKIPSFPSKTIHDLVHSSLQRNKVSYVGVLCIPCHHHHHHHHVALSARISVTLSRHPSLSHIASGRSSGLHPYR